MQTKHFISDPELMVVKSLKSLSIIQPNLTVDLQNKIVYAPQAQDDRRCVSIISGGGAGHEPSFTGMVGEGLLTAAVSGSIFASPSSQQVLQAIENVDSSKGVLVTVMRYTGDMLNFGVALEKARARNPSMKIEMLVVSDDVAVTRSNFGKVERRGIAGTVLVHKITGAMARAGYELDEIVRVGRSLCDNLASIGASLNRVHIPGRPIDQQNMLGTSDIELGMGIHNETGCGKRSGAEAEVGPLVKEMLGQVLDTSDHDRGFLPRTTEDMILLVNNLGGLSVLELGAIASEVAEQLERDWHIRPLRVYVGTYMTSLDGPGFSISLLNNTPIDLQHSLVQLLDYPSNVRGWQSVHRQEAPRKLKFTEDSGATSGKVRADAPDCDLRTLSSRLDSGLQAVINAESEITRYDNVVGDGDCGTTLKRGAEAIRKRLAAERPQDIVELLSCIATTIEDTMDGTSGALYAIFANALLRHVKQKAGQDVEINQAFWTESLLAATGVLSSYTPAQVGDRTMMDALLPFVDALKRLESVGAAAEAARDGAEKTKNMRPGLGRTVYIGNEDEWMGKIPDPGAWGLSQLLMGIAQI